MTIHRGLGAVLFTFAFASLGSCTDSESNIGANKQKLQCDGSSCTSSDDGGDSGSDDSGSSTFVSVSTCAELEAISSAPTLNYRLSADIDCTGYDAAGDGFDPIADFAGMLDGAGHVITGLSVSQPNAKAGLFAKLAGGTVTELGLVGASIFGGAQVGCIAGFAENATLREVFCRGAAIEGKKHVGALVGHASGTTVFDSYAHADVGCSGKQCGLLLGQAKQGTWTHGYGAISSDIAPSRAGIENAFDWQTTFFDCDVAGGCAEAGAQSTANLQEQAFLVSQGWDFGSVSSGGTWGMSSDFGYACLLWEPGCGAVCASEDSSCNGEDDDCDGNVDEDFVQTETLCGVGACTARGVLSCSSGVVTDSCAPGTPAASDATCDLLDDDCDGQADEGYQSQTTSCGQGSCGAEGQTSCVDGVVEDSCEPGTPAANDSTCDGLDNDCDGSIDEAYLSESTTCGEGICSAEGATSCVSGEVLDSCAPGAPASDDAVCDGIDDDCDGALDEHYVSQSTSCGLGVCRGTGSTSCAAGTEEDSCTEEAPQSSSDSTCDGLDDDCDGTEDEDYVSQSTSCGVGACGAEGATSCDGGTVTDSCQPGVPAADDSLCNGIDDDCNGFVDEDYVSQSTSCGIGACGAEGATSCAGGTVTDSCQPGAPAADDSVCNGIDDDCNGLVDEDYVSQSPSCGIGACGAEGATSCVGGAVQDSCTPGSPAASDATCDGIDDDCDAAEDEDYASTSTSCGIGACGAGGQTTCDAGTEGDTCTPGTPAADDSTCDGIDDDCDGTVDEDCDQIPDSLELVAPPLSKTGTTSFTELVSYYYDNANPIQREVDFAAFEEERIAGIFGYVLDRAGNPVDGVRVRVKFHEEFGYTETRSDGRFDMAVNGGNRYVVTYSAPGYLGVDREVKTEWNAFSEVPSIVVTEKSATVTTVSLGSASYQTAITDSETDADGSRTPRVLIPPGTTATLSLPDGTTQPLSGSANLRVTEYTVGEDGEEAMPAVLPPASGYTYAMELSFDEADALGATRVELSQPLPYYYENFLGFPVGTPVPLGYYDRENGQWVGDDPGVVLSVLAVSGGLAEIDVDGDGQADDEATTGISDAERQAMASELSAGQSYVRVVIPHFTPWDANQGIFPPDDAEDPPSGEQAQDDVSFDDEKTTCGSVIGCTRKTLGESVPLSGTSSRLHYHSERMPFAGERFDVTIPLTLAAFPASLESIVATVQVAGQSLRYEEDAVSLEPNKSVTLTWDGLDAAGRRVQGEQIANVSLFYCYQAQYTNSGQFGYNGGGNISTIGPSRQTICLASTWKERMGRINFGPDSGVAGWGLTENHRFDPFSGEVWHGDGTKRHGASQYSTVEHVATLTDQGANTCGNPGIYTFDAEGWLYFWGSRGIRKYRESEGVVRVSKESYTAPSPIADGTQVIDADFDGVRDMAFDRDNRLIVMSRGHERIYRVERDGSVKTIAGGGTIAPTADGVEGTAALFPESFSSGAMAHDPVSGVTYVATPTKLYRIGNDGIVRLIAGGGGTGCNPAQGSDAASSPFCYFRSLQVDHKGQPVMVSDTYRLQGVDESGRVFYYSLPSGVYLVSFSFVSDGSFYWYASGGLRRTMPDGLTLPIVGGAPPLTPVTGVPAQKFDMSGIGASFVLEPNGNLLLYEAVTGCRSYLRRVKNPALPVVVSEDGTLVYDFDLEGRHLRTRDSLTDVTLRTFEYDAKGRLIRSIDREGLVTEIVRDSSGLPTSIVAPYGHVTTLGTDLDGYLASVSNALGESYLFSYDPSDEGALRQMVDPLSRPHDYIFADGVLLRDEDPVGGYKELSPTALSDGERIEVSTALSRTTSYEVTRDDSNGTSYESVISPAGFSSTRSRNQGSVEVYTAPDGTVTTATFTGDPRNGMDAPYPSKVTTVLPSGLTKTVTMSRVARDNFNNAPTPSDSGPSNLWYQNETTRVHSDANASLYYNKPSNYYQFTSPEGRTSTTNLDSLGRVSEVSVPGIAPVDYAYDADGRIQSITQTSATDGTRTTTYAYDTDGFLASVTAPSLRSTSYTYDAVGRPLTTTLPDSETLSTSWDAMDNLKSITPPGKTAHLFSYTPRDQVQRYEPPDATNATSNAYDLDRDLDLQTLMSARTIDPLMDSAGRLDSVTIDRGVIDFSYRTSDGKLETITSPEGNTLTMGYDGPLTTSVTWAGDVNAQVAFGYDNHFRVTSLTVDSQAPITYAYDQDNYITNANGMTVTRDAQSGLLTGTTYTDAASSNSVASTRTHNDFGEVQSMIATYTSGDLGYNFAYDVDGRIASRAETSGASSSTQTYDYDLRGRLTDVYVDGLLTYEYDYDENGNRLAYTGPEGSISATYDAQDRLLTYGTNAYIYNADGQLVTKTSGTDVTSYEYDELGGLNRVTLPDSTVIDYVLDGAGRRIAKKVNGTVVRQWVYQDGLNPVAEYDGSGNLIQQFVYATRINVPDLIIRGGTTYRIIADQIGSVRRIVEVSTGAVVQEITYSPFGKVLSDSSPGWQPFAFAGGLYDQQTKFLRFGARDYDAEVGRWTAKDPIGFDGRDSNLFAYVSGDPVRFIDPLGLLRFDPVDGQKYANLAYDIYTIRNNLSGRDIAVAASILKVPIAEVEQALKPGQGPIIYIASKNRPCRQVTNECGESVTECVQASTASSSEIWFYKDVGQALDAQPNGRKASVLAMHEVMHALYMKKHGNAAVEPTELGWEWERQTGRAPQTGCMCK